MQKSARKTVSYDTGMIREAEYYATSYHMDFSDFSRFILAQKLEALRNQERENTLIFSDATSRAVLRGKKEYQEGKTKSFKNGTEFMNYLRAKRKKH